VRRRLIAVCSWALMLVLIAGPAAVGKDLGSDVLGNISPQSQLGGGGLADRYPLSAFSLDYHTDIGITQLDGVPPTIAQWAAAQTGALPGPDTALNGTIRKSGGDRLTDDS
jgi:hypothetical protein